MDLNHTCLLNSELTRVYLITNLTHRIEFLTHPQVLGRRRSWRKAPWGCTWGSWGQPGHRGRMVDVKDFSSSLRASRWDGMSFKWDHTHAPLAPHVFCGATFASQLDSFFLKKKLRFESNNTSGQVTTASVKTHLQLLWNSRKQILRALLKTQGSGSSTSLVATICEISILINKTEKAENKKPPQVYNLIYIIELNMHCT